MTTETESKVTSAPVQATPVTHVNMTVKQVADKLGVAEKNGTSKVAGASKPSQVFKFPAKIVLDLT